MTSVGFNSAEAAALGKRVMTPMTPSISRMDDPWPRWWKRIGTRGQRVIPHGVTNTNVKPELLGKVPGYLDEVRGLWVPTTGPMKDRALTLEEARQGQRTGAAIGVLGSGFPGLDIDFNDALLVRKIIILAELYFGPARCRGRENSAHCLLMYEGTGIRKRRIECDDGAVEWLGEGQYYNVDGIHPSGVPYTWTAPHPCDAELGRITNDMVGAFCIDLVALLERHGRKVRRYRHSGATGTRKPLGDPLLAAGSPSIVLAALAAYDCSPEHFKSRDDIVPFLCGIKGALGNAHEAHRETVLAWFRKHPSSTDDEYFDHIWDSIHDSELGWDWLDRTTGAGIGAQTDYKNEPAALASMDPRAAAVESMLFRFRYARSQSRFVNVETGEILKHGDFDTQNTAVAPCGTAGKKAAHNQFFNHPKAGNHRGLTYRPGQGLIVDDEVNTWRPSGLKPIAGDAAPWLDHVAELIPDPGQRDHFLDWMAYVLQRPGAKINHAIVLYTVEHGWGKDTALAPLRAGVGARNYRTVVPEELTAVHTRYLQAQVIYVPEMKNFSKGEVYNRLKTQLARPPDTVLLRLMYTDVIEIPNTQCWVFSTNAGDAIALEPSDRRFWVPDCNGHARDDAGYYTRLWHWLLAENGLEIAVGWLLKRDVTRFDPHDAPMTQAKQDMIDLAAPPGMTFLESQFEPEGALHGREHVTTFELRQLLNDNFSTSPLRDVHLVEILRRHGFHKIPGKHRIDGEIRNIWTKLKRLTSTPNDGGISMALRLQADRKQQKK